MANYDDIYIPVRTAAEIDLNKIRHNYAVIRKTFPGTKVLSVLKADAYGHGIRGITAVCDEQTDYFAVATVEEGCAIRESGSIKPVLVFGVVPDALIQTAAQNDLTFSVGSVSYARRLSKKLKSCNLSARCHLKIDTGMNRAGIRWREGEEARALDEIYTIYRMPELSFTGIYTHFPCPESTLPEDIAFTDRQYLRFSEACSRLSEHWNIGIRHCLSTGGSIARPEYKMDMIRVGMMAYGQCDTEEHQKKLGLQEALRWYSYVTQVELLNKGESVSYGRTFTAPENMRIGVVSCGYADGYRRCYQAGGKVLIRGKRCAVLGRICMDFLMVDLTDIPDAAPGMQVVLLGSQGNEHISAIEIAEENESTCGEVTLAISARVPRYYVN